MIIFTIVTVFLIILLFSLLLVAAGNKRQPKPNALFDYDDFLKYKYGEEDHLINGRVDGRNEQEEFNFTIQRIPIVERERKIDLSKWSIEIDNSGPVICGACGDTFENCGWNCPVFGELRKLFDEDLLTKYGFIIDDKITYTRTLNIPWKMEVYKNATK